MKTDAPGQKRPALAIEQKYVHLDMAKAKKTTWLKLHADKYDGKLAIIGTFADVFKVVKKNKEEK